MAFIRLLLGVLFIALVSCATANVEEMKRSEAHFKLGVSHLNSGNIQPAYVEFQTSLKYDPNNKQAHNALGTVYLKLQDLQAAEEQFQNAARIDPTFSDAYNNLCYVQYLMRKWDDAIANCKNALSNPLYITPEKAYYNMGRAYYRKGLYDDALNAYGEALKRMPALHLAYYGRALAYNGKRQYGLAADEMSKAIQLDPRFKGDRTKAEEEFSSSTGSMDEVQDFKDFLEILKY